MRTTSVHPSIDLPTPTGPIRAFTLSGLPYAIVSLLMLVAWAALALAVSAITGELQFHADRGHLLRLSFWELLQGSLIVYLFTCEFLSRRGVGRDLHEVREEVELHPDEFDDIVRDSFRQPRVTQWSNVLIPLAVCVAMVEFDPAIWVDRAKPPATSPVYWWAVVRNTMMGWAAARLVMAEIRWTRAYVQIAERLRVPLPRGAVSQPFVRKGLRSAAYWLVFSSIFSLFWASDSAGTFNPVLFAVALGFATYALFVPLSAFRATVREAKRAEFDRVDREIEAERGPLLASTSRDASRVASLVAWRELVERVDEWPLSAPAAFRFALFVLLGLGSWLGGALVERGVDVFLE